MADIKNKNVLWWSLICTMIVIISALHYTTSTMNWQYHLIYMQSYFIPILVAAFQFGVRGGILSAVFVSVLYLPHIMLHWGGLIEANLMRFLQIVLFYVIGYLTGFKAKREQEEKKRFQETAGELERSLRILNERTEKLSDLEKQLRQYDRLSVIGELTASLAHEVRNPLGSIRGAVEIMQDELPEAMKKSEFFRILIEETKRLNTVVENYLQYARRQAPEMKIFDIKETIQNARILLSGQFSRNGHELILKLPDKSCFIKGDPNQLWQILINLLLNADQAMPEEGEILISLTGDGESLKDKRELKEQSHNGYYKLTVTDRGIGLAPEQIKEIFKPFFSSKPGGTGLGLAIVKRIVVENNWQIEIDSKQGEGTSFHLIIPSEVES